jgi:hypothetical protein
MMVLNVGAWGLALILTTVNLAFHTEQGGTAASESLMLFRYIVCISVAAIISLI